jgi:hypothetical protein
VISEELYVAFKLSKDRGEQLEKPRRGGYIGLTFLSLTRGWCTLQSSCFYGRFVSCLILYHIPRGGGLPVVVVATVSGDRCLKRTSRF